MLINISANNEAVTYSTLEANRSAYVYRNTAAIPLREAHTLSANNNARNLYHRDVKLFEYIVAGRPHSKGGPDPFITSSRAADIICTSGVILISKGRASSRPPLKY